MSVEPKRKQMNIDIINPDTYEWIDRIAKNQDTSKRKAANDLLDMLAEREKFLKDVFPDLKKIAFTDGQLFIQDKKMGGSVATIGLNEKQFVYCQLCKKIDCPHVLYSMALIEIVRLEPLAKKK